MLIRTLPRRRAVLLAWILAMGGCLRAEVTIDAASLAATTTRPNITGTTSDATELWVSVRDSHHHALCIYSSKEGRWPRILTSGTHWSFPLCAYGQAGMPPGDYQVEVSAPISHPQLTVTLTIRLDAASLARIEANARICRELTPLQRFVVTQEARDGLVVSVTPVSCDGVPGYRVVARNEEEDLTFEMTSAGRIVYRDDAWRTSPDDQPLLLEALPAQARQWIANAIAQDHEQPAPAIESVLQLGTPQQPYCRMTFKHPTRIHGSTQTFWHIPRSLTFLPDGSFLDRTTCEQHSPHGKSLLARWPELGEIAAVRFHEERAGGRLPSRLPEAATWFLLSDPDQDRVYDASFSLEDRLGSDFGANPGNDAPLGTSPGGETSLGEQALALSGVPIPVQVQARQLAPGWWTGGDRRIERFIDEDRRAVYRFSWKQLGTGQPRMGLLMLNADGSRYDFRIPLVGSRILQVAQARWHDATASQLGHGRSILLGECEHCHGAVSPFSRPAESWTVEVANMSDAYGRSRLLDVVSSRPYLGPAASPTWSMQLSIQDQEDLLRYLQATSLTTSR